MKHFLLITSLLLSITAFAEDNTNTEATTTEDTNLLAKCSPESSHDYILPGEVFFYIIKEEDQLFVIHAIAHKKDNFFVREQTLRANFPLYELKEAENNSFYWDTKNTPANLFNESDSRRLYRINSIPSIEDLKKYSSSARTKTKTKTKNNKGFFITLTGNFDYANNSSVYYACFIWFDWLEKL